jgi:hypothetical protein
LISVVCALAIGLLPRPTVRSASDLPSLREAFLRGDLVTVERGKEILRAGGEDVRKGSIALLDDLSRLVRCLPLGPIPHDEVEPYLSARQLVRLERVRLEQLIKDGMHKDSALVELLAEPSMFQAAAADQSDQLVRWPVEDERWPEEVIEGRVWSGVCPSAPGLKKETDKKTHAQNAKWREKTANEMLTRAVDRLEALQPDAAAKIALAYLEQWLGIAEPSFEDAWYDKLAAGLRRARTSERAAGMIILARFAEMQGLRDRATDLYRELLEIEGKDTAALTAEEDSRVRTRLVGLLEPNWNEALEVARKARSPRAADEAVLSNAIARALYSLEQWDELRTFGRAWLRRAHKDEPHEVMTGDLLVRLATQLDPSDAMSWMQEVGPDDPKSAMVRLDQLGKLAIESGNLPLAVRVYDRLRIESAGSREKTGPSAALDEARWISERARIAFIEEDAASFAGFIDEILRLSDRESDRPLARIAPHREVARLCQDLLGRLTNETPSKPERRKFAALLLEAAVRLSSAPGRMQAVLTEYVSPLRVLAGPYAVGRDGRAPAAARKSDKPSPAAARKGERKVHQLGEVIVPRLPPRLEAVDVPTSLPKSRSLLVFEAPSGEWRVGAPWAELARDRKRPAKKREEE